MKPVQGSETSFTMNNNKLHLTEADSPVYDNQGFQREVEGRAWGPSQGSYPSLPQLTPSYVVSAPRTINTHHTAIPGPAQSPRQEKETRQCHWKNVLCACLCVAVILAVVALLLWYFLYYQCLLGKSCGAGGKCLSSSQWCDGVLDCSRGEDESHCFRLQGTDSMLESYSSHNDAWMPVCVDDWNDDYGKTVCEQIGYTRQDYETYAQIHLGASATKGYMRLKPGTYYGSHIQSHFTHSMTCSAAVKLHCSECGRSQAGPSSRIVGGAQAENGAWPWQVSLQFNGRHMCGGSIISADWILSAAHCFQEYSNPSGWKVFSGDVSLSRMRFGDTVQRIINHENYDSNTNDNDIALLKLGTPMAFTRTVRPVCLPNSGIDMPAGSQAWITGWGALRSSGQPPDKLNQAQVTIYSRDICNEDHVLNGQVTQTMICAGRLQGGVDTCQGDSGGPLVVKAGDVWWLAGDTSWGIGCALRNKPGVYGNVTYFINWIYEQMQDN
ncbi:transmembrane protease serine 2 [Cololabis saira]|uniref:transmembrane protease serine 2 n=1 Tax=Cololabis saira TaxID=129043 RepID=UPI002AD4B2AA|nr:transmembrane protease serine 2 [Cololabis saira]